MFKSLMLAGWRQFHSIEIDFNSRVTILTGRNATGKSTILNILGLHFSPQGPSQVVSSPVLDNAGRLVYSSDARQKQDAYSVSFGEDLIIGEVRYEDETQVFLTVPKHPTHGIYSVRRSNLQQFAPGFSISSARHGAYHAHVSEFSATPPIPEKMVEHTVKELLKFPPDVNDPLRGSYVIRKRDLLNALTHGLFARPGIAQIDSLRIAGAYQEALKALFPPELQFQGLDIVGNEIVFLTKSGNFSMDAMSAGLSFIADIAWLGTIYSLCYDKFVVCLDEPENHLHPSMQRRLLPSLATYFQQAKFVVATHNPLVVTSERSANVYALEFNTDGFVDSARLEWRDHTGTANDTLRDILGTELTIPDWADQDLQTILKKYQHHKISDEMLDKLGTELKSAGFGRYLPRVMTQVIRENDIQQNAEFVDSED